MSKLNHIAVIRQDVDLGDLLNDLALRLEMLNNLALDIGMNHTHKGQIGLSESAFWMIQGALSEAHAVHRVIQDKAIELLENAGEVRP